VANDNFKKRLWRPHFLWALAEASGAPLWHRTHRLRMSHWWLRKKRTRTKPAREKIVVTGSRLRRDEFSSLSPLQVVDGEVAKDLGIVDAQSILSNTTVTSGQQNTLGVSTAFNGGLQQAFTTIGSVTPSLRGLGSSVTGRSRSLVLVNGRRLGPVGVGGAPANPDISLIPGSLIERTDILLDGASSIYGSDAIGGVVNYIIRSDFDGVELSAFTTQPEAGWGQNDVFSLTAGVNNDRGFIGFAVEYNEQEEIEKQDVLSEFFGPVNDVQSQFDIDGGLPPSLCVADISDTPGIGQRQICSGTPAGFLIAGGLGNIIGGEGGAVTPGSTPIDGAPGFFLRPGNLSFFRPTNDPAVNGFPQDYGDTYLPQVQRTSIYTVGEYNLGVYGDMTAFFEGQYGNRQLTTQTTNQEVMPISADNPFNPFGASGLFVYSVENGVDQDIDLFRTLGGVRGDLPDIQFGDFDNWNYEVFVSWHRSNGFQAQTGFLQEDRIAQGLNSSVDPVTGQIVCESPGTNPSNGGFSFFGFDTVRAPINCVPLNPFVPQFLTAGQFATDEQNDFAYGTGIQQTAVEQIIGGGYATGDVFKWPLGGTSQFLIGAEYRIDKVRTTPGDSTRFGLLQGVDADLGANGKRDIREAFFELSLPFLENQPFAESLSIETAARWTEEEFAGAAWTYQVKGEYKPVDYFTVRTGFGTSFRAPDTGEQFGTGTVFVQPSRADPCLVSSLQIDSTTGAYDPALETRDPVVIDNCIALGLDPTTAGTVNQEDGDPTTTAFVSNPVAFGNFGNLATEPETSEALFAGLVFEQPFFDSFDFRISATYFDYLVEGSIGQLTRGQILDECFTSVGLTDPLCAFQERDPSGALVAVNEASINLGAVTSRGYDVNANLGYEFQNLPFTEDPVALDWDLVFTQQLENTEDVLGDGNATDNLGRLRLGGGFPDYQGISTVTLEWTDWRANFRSRYVSDLFGTPDQGNSFASCFDLEANERLEGCVEREFTDTYWQHDLTLAYIGDNWSVRGGVINLFDEVQYVDNELSQFNVAIQAGHDIYGRRFFVSASKAF